MKQDASFKMNQVNKLSLALKYQASNIIEERQNKYIELFTENQAFIYCQEVKAMHMNEMEKVNWPTKIINVKIDIV